MPFGHINLWDRIMASLWATIMALLGREASETPPDPVTELETGLRDLTLRGTDFESSTKAILPLRKKEPRNEFLSKVLASQQTGRVSWTPRTLPKDVCKRMKIPKGRGRGGPKKNMAWLCEKLERRTVKFKQASCFKVVSALREHISEITCADYMENREAMILLRGDVLLVKVLLISEKSASKPREGIGRQGGGLQLQAMCLQTLLDLCYGSRACLENLCWDNDLLLFLFKSMQSKELFSAGLGLAEEMIGYRDKQLDLRLVPNFTGLVQGLSDEQLTVFCRLLTLAVSGPEDYREPIERLTEPGIVDWRKPRSRWSVAKSFKGSLQDVFSNMEEKVSLSERNHALLLDLPGLLPRLVKLLGSNNVGTEVTFSEFLSETLQPLLRTHPTIEQGAPPEVQTLIRLMRGGLTGARIAHGAGAGGVNTLEIVVDPVGGVDDSDVDPPEDMQQEMQRTMEQQAWQYKVEILFMFCSICEGREVTRLQDELAKLGLVPVLKDLFDSLDWDVPPPTGPQEAHGLHGPGCECNPEVTMKVQLLKMIHCLCERNGDNRHNKALFVLPETLPEDPSSDTRDISASQTSQHSIASSSRLVGVADAVSADVAGDDVASAEMAVADVANDDVANDDVANDDVGSREMGKSHDRLVAGNGLFGTDSGHLNAASKEEFGGGSIVMEGGDFVDPRVRGQSAASTSSSGADEGLMGKVVRTLMKQTSASSFRFWLASCIEVFMRGSDPRHQRYVARFGLMEHLVDQILKPGFQLSSEYQINFDLLSELVKFNPAMFARLNGLLEGPRFDRFMEVVTEHLIDTNVFIRSLVLSVQYFRHGTPVPPYQSNQDSPPASLATSLLNPSQSDSIPADSGCPSPLSGSYSSSFHRRTLLSEPGSCKLQTFLSCNRTRLLYDLMQAVDKDDVTQDNMCVVNTSLLFFLFAHREGQLLPLLQRLRARENEASRALLNFRALLEYWKHYYLRQRGRDSRSIEYSTNMPFQEWLHMVELLSGPDEDPLSLTFGLVSQ